MIDVVLPCLNEAAALPWVLDRMPPGYHAIVADNGSTDGSGHIAREWGATVVYASPRGFGAAAHAGLAAARADVVCFLDADGSLDPRQLPRVVAGILAGSGRPRSWPTPADGAEPGRSTPGWATPPSPGGCAGWSAPRSGISVRCGPPVAAPCWSWTSWTVGSATPLEMVVKAGRAGWRVSEVDVDYAPRVEGGRSKVTGTLGGTLRTIVDMSRTSGGMRCRSWSWPSSPRPGQAKTRLCPPCTPAQAAAVASAALADTLDAAGATRAIRHTLVLSGRYEAPDGWCVVGQRGEDSRSGWPTRSPTPRYRAYPRC